MYIVFEGIIGAGKTTQCFRLSHWLEDKFPKLHVLCTREPGGDEIAESIRGTVQGTPFKEQMDATCEAYLYAAARAQSLRTVVKPRLDSGWIIIADRSFITSLVYQGYNRGVGIDTILDINKVAVSGILPDLVLFLDANVPTALGRAHDKAGDKWENLGEDFFVKAREGYMKVSHLSNLFGKWVGIDGNGTEDEVFQRILQEVTPFIHSNEGE